MLFWILATLLTLLTLAFVVWPLVRRAPKTADAGTMATAIYRDQLAELDREVASGTADAAQVQASRTEIARRLLAADAKAAAEAPAAPPAPARTRSYWLAAMLAVGLPVAAVALYWTLGQPQYITGTPGAQTVAAAAGEHTDLRPLVAELQARLQTAPDDLEGWVTLARTQFQLGDHAAAAEAYARAIALAGPDEVALRGERGEAVVLTADGIVTEMAMADFAAVLQQRPTDPRARYYSALGKAQSGKLRAALDDWQALVRDSPVGAPWLPAVNEQIRVVAESLGEPVAPVTPSTAAGPQAGMSGASPAATALARRLLSDAAEKAGLARPAAAPDSAARTLAGTLLAQTAPPSANTATPTAPERGPTAEQVAELSQRPQSEQQAMIEGMVSGLAERLKENPDDADGWMKLGRSYLVLGKSQESVDAFAQAATHAPDRPDIQAAYAEALIMTSPDAQVSAEAGKLLNRVLLLDPMNPRALWHMGRLASSQGDTAQARALWGRLLQQIDPASPEHKLVSDAIASLK
jgi:cytochrome c-type biogenesis protein CcmH